MNKERVYLYDSTLRDGAQTSGVDFNAEEKIRIAEMLDELAIDYIEGGWPGANPTDDRFFATAPKLHKAKLAAFGMTTRAGIAAANDPSLTTLTASGAKAICIVGKSWLFHVEHALAITPAENLKIIADSIAYIVSQGLEPIFDGEHFFDGYKSNPDFALSTLRAAYDNGARWVVLCDTNGGSMPDEISSIVSAVAKHIPNKSLGIHCHNDAGLAVANSIAAVNAGVRQVQGTINGLGERCGNANLITLIPNLALKLGYDIGPAAQNMQTLTKLSHLFNELLGKDAEKYSPYVGSSAFAHKGGLHVSAMLKNSACYEHINPAIVGNSRKILVSDQAGRSNIIAKLKEIGLKDGDNEIKYSQVSSLVHKVKELEDQGYAFDGADASFELLVLRFLGKLPEFFTLQSFQIIDEMITDRMNSSQATISIQIDDEVVNKTCNGNGPIHALDTAFRAALSSKYKVLANLQLSDYKVRILNPARGTEAITRVHIESTDLATGAKWSTIGVSSNLVEASYKALEDGVLYRLLH